MKTLLLFFLLLCSGCADNLTFEQRKALLAISQGMQTFGDEYGNRSQTPIVFVNQQPTQQPIQQTPYVWQPIPH